MDALAADRSWRWEVGNTSTFSAVTLQIRNLLPIVGINVTTSTNPAPLPSGAYDIGDEITASLVGTSGLDITLPEHIYRCSDTVLCGWIDVELVTAQPVPEPATIGLLAVGLIGVVARTRRRRAGTG